MRAPSRRSARRAAARLALARLSAALLAGALALGAGCARPRDISQPVPGALVRSYPDSADAVFEAAAYAITDEGFDIVQQDRRRSYVESRWVDANALRVPIGATVPQTGTDRVVRFQFRTERTFGATRLVGEAVTRLTGRYGGRADDDMVPANHPARAVLERMFERVDERLRTARERREREGPDSTPARTP
jgi:hypothetical protein